MGQNPSFNPPTHKVVMVVVRGVQKPKPKHMLIKCEYMECVCVVLRVLREMFKTGDRGTHQGQEIPVP